MKYNFDGQVAIVTGAGGGLGFAYAKYLADRGAKVLVNDLGSDPMGFSSEHDVAYAVRAADAINKSGGEAIANKNSVAQWESAQAIVQQAINTWGRVDIVINNAGITSPAVFPMVEKEDMESQHSVHVMGTVNLMRAAWPYMMSQGRGRIVNVASASLYGFCPQIPYPAMKGAVLALTKNLALVGAEHNIFSNVIMPVAISRMSGLLPDSPFKQKLENECSPEKIAPLVAYLCHPESDANGELFSVGKGKFYRSVYAASQTVDIDESMESVAQGMPSAMDESKSLAIVHNAFDDLDQLGFAPEDYEKFRDMSATVGAHAVAPEIEAVNIDSVDDVWQLTVKSPVGDQFSNLVLKSDGMQLVGHVLNKEYGASEVQEGEIENKNALLWKCKLSKPMPMTMHYKLQMDNEKQLSGHVQAKMLGKVVMDSVVVGKLLTGEDAAIAKKQSAEEPREKAGFFKGIFGK